MDFSTHYKKCFSKFEKNFIEKSIVRSRKLKRQSSTEDCLFWLLYHKIRTLLFQIKVVSSPLGDWF